MHLWNFAVTPVTLRYQCNICEQSYCVKLEEVPLLECALCGQGSHNSCILDLFGVLPAEQDNFGPEEAKTKINPVSLPGLNYLLYAELVRMT